MKRYLEPFSDNLDAIKQVREWCENREQLLFDTIRSPAGEDGIIQALSGARIEIDNVVKYIEEQKEKRASQYFF
jgi:hypothetical protein